MSFNATNNALFGLAIAIDPVLLSPASSLPSSPESPQSIFSDASISSSSCHTEPDSSPDMGDDSSDEDNFTVYSDEEFEVEYVARTQEDAEDFRVSDFLPWPT